MPTCTRKTGDRTSEKRSHIILRISDGRLIFSWSISVLYLHLSRLPTAVCRRCIYPVGRSTGCLPAKHVRVIERTSIDILYTSKGRSMDPCSGVFVGSCHSPPPPSQHRLQDRGWNKLLQRETVGTELLSLSLPLVCKRLKNVLFDGGLIVLGWERFCWISVEVE